MKKALVVIIVLLLTLLAVGCKGGGDTIQIGIIQLADHPALDASRNGFIDALKDEGYVDGENIKIDYHNGQGDQNNLSTISDRFVGNKVDMVLAIATDAAQAIAGKTTEIPILGTAITDYEVAGLVNSNEKPGTNVSGTTDMNPIKEQIELLIELKPDIKTLGVLYTSSEDNSVLQAQIAKGVIEGKGLDYVEVTVTNTNEVQQATQSIVTQCDGIYIPTDNVFASAMPVVYGVTVESKTPVVCGESNMVKGGGLATLGINYYDLGYQTGKMAVRVLSGKAKIEEMPIEALEKFDYAINKDVAEAIGIDIPDKYKDYIVGSE